MSDTVTLTHGISGEAMENALSFFEQNRVLPTYTLIQRTIQIYLDSCPKATASDTITLTRDEFLILRGTLLFYGNQDYYYDSPYPLIQADGGVLARNNIAILNKKLEEL
jgi:hypothetical protein